MRGAARWAAAALALAALAAGQDTARLDRSIGTAMRQWREPGLAIAVVKDGREVFARGYGVRRLGEAAPVDEDTVFAIGSLTKAFTSAAAAMLVDEGKLGWDDRVIDHLPWFRMYDPWVTREIRLRDLMCHRSGLPPYGGDLMVFGSSYGRRELLDRVAFLKPASSFRTRFAYSNLMFLAAGEVVEAAAGLSWDEFIGRRIFGPLGMTRSSTTVRGLERQGDVAYPNGYIAGASREVPRRNADNIGPAGSINSTARDMARWMTAQLGRGQVAGKRLFSEAASRQMWEIQTPRPVEAAGADEPLFNGYGLGWGISEFRGRKMLSHAGGLAGMTSFIALLPAEGLGVVVLTNGELPLAPAVAREALDTYLGAAARDWAGEAWSRFTLRERNEESAWMATMRRHRPPAAAPDATEFAGTYRDEAFGEVNVAAQGAGIEVKLAPLPGAVGQGEPWAEQTYLIHWRNAAWPPVYATFERAPGGLVDGLRMKLARGADDSLDFGDYDFKRTAEAGSTRGRK